MSFPNNGAPVPGTGNQSNNDLSQQLVQQLQLAMQQQQPQTQSNAPQPLIANQLALQALLANPAASLALPGSTAAAAAAPIAVNPPQQQPALLTLPQLQGSILAPGLPAIPLPAVSGAAPAPQVAAAANPTIDCMQLLALAQLQAQQVQHQHQQMIAQLLLPQAAAAPNAAATFPPALSLGVLASVLGQPVGVPPAAAAAQVASAAASAEASASSSPSISASASVRSQVNLPTQRERTEKTPKPAPLGSSSNIPPTHRPPIALTTEYDSRSLNPYQCLLRKQIELFETSESTGVEGCSQGRNAKIQIGQVGIRCRHCARLPNKSRPKGAVYYSKTVRGVYQTSQNMAHVHFAERCKTIPKDIRAKLQRLYGTSRRATAGKDYWEECLRSQGVYEDGSMLRFKPLVASSKDKKKKKSK